MEDKYGTKAQLLQELAQLRQQIAEPETSATRCEGTGESLERQQDYFRALIENSLDPIVIVAGDGKVRYESPSYERVLGYKAEEGIGRDMTERIHPDDIPRVREAFAQAVANPGGTMRFELRARHRDGSWRFMEAVGSNLLDDPAVRGLIVNMRDITERERADVALRAREERFRALIENSSDVIIILDGNGIISEESPSIKRLLGSEPGALIGRQMLEFIHPEDVPRAAEAFSSLVASPGNSVSVELRIRHRDGSWRAVEGVGKNLLHDPQVRGIVANYREITERKRGEEALRESERRYRLLAENLSDVIWTMDKGFKYTYVSPSITRLRGYSVEEAMTEKLRDCVTPESWKVVIHALKEDQAAEVAEHGDRYETRMFELELTCKDGSTVWTENRVTLLRDSVGKLTGYLGVTRDISAWKQAEEALRESEAKYSTLVEQAKDGVVVVQDEVCKFSNRAMTQMTGYSPEEVEGSDYLDLVDYEHRDLIVRRHDARMAGEDIPPVVEFRIRSKHGTVREVEASAATIQYQGRPALMAIVRDITERKRVQEALRESEEKMRSLIENSPDIISIVNREGRIQFVNRTVSGLTLEETIGRDVCDFTQPEYREMSRRSRAQVFETGEATKIEAQGVGPNGSISWYETRFAPIKRDGEVVAVMAIVTDITERKQAEEEKVEHAAALARAEELKVSRQRIVAVQESLRRDIAHEIHGSVQNRLIILLHRLTELEHSAPSLAVELGSLRQNLADLLDSQIRPISHRLYPSILRQGLVPALQSLGDRFEAALAIEMAFDGDLVRRERTNRRLIPERVRLAACRIAEEALTNVVKHGKASKVTIGLKPSNGCLRLTVKDDGQGFEVEGASGGLGILMIQDYAEVVGGSCVVHSAPGEGTEVMAVLPLAGFGEERPETALSSE